LNETLFVISTPRMMDKNKQKKSVN